MKNVVHLRTTIVSQFAVIDEDGNTIAIHETEPQWTGALREDEFIRIMQQNRAIREELKQNVNAGGEPEPALSVETPKVEPTIIEDSPCCGENRSHAS